MINGELIVDNFAGGGGASTGIEIATGISVDIAINHLPKRKPGDIYEKMPELPVPDLHKCLLRQKEMPWQEKGVRWIQWIPAN